MELQARTTFGRRGGVAEHESRPARGIAPNRSPTQSLDSTESGVPLNELAAQLYGNRQPGQQTAEPSAYTAIQTGIVPWSWSAALLAGLVTSCLLAGVTLYDIQHASASVPPQLAELLGESVSTKLGPALLLESLVSGGRVTASIVFLVHAALRPFRITHPLGYGLAGAGLGAALVQLGNQLGVPLGFHDMLPGILGGFTAGFFYRTFAGANSPAKV